jgi:hypothetical protein
MSAEAHKLDKHAAIAIDPRSCEHCGLTIDRHRMVDDGDGPIFYCLDVSSNELTLEELERRAELIRQIEVAEIFARLEAMDDPSRRPPPPRSKPKPYRTPQSTIDAFWYVVREGNTEKLEDWLAAHPRDAGYLVKRLQEKLDKSREAAR